MSTAANRQVIQTGIGAPEDVIVIAEEPVPDPGAGEVLVELVMAPINPAEILMLRGEYGYAATVPTLPRLTGIEGVGRVVSSESGRLPAGSRVSLAGTPGVFGDYRVLKASEALAVPDEVSTDVMALTFVNTQSVLLMLEGWPDLREGSWLIQNAGNSGYARILDAVAARRGLGVVNVVRSERAADQIAGSARGPIVVEPQDQQGHRLREAVLQVTGGQEPVIAVDAVAGTSSGRLARTLARGGRLVNYGLMAQPTMSVDARLMLFNDVRLEGFWMPIAMNRIGEDRLRALALEALEILATDPVDVPIESSYDLNEAVAAFARAGAGERDGKVVLTR